jgi:uncharacterized membrane protein
MDIGRVLKDSWVIFTKDWGVLVVSALVTLALSLVSLGILGGPLCAGLYLMVVRRVRQGRKPEVRDVFACFDRIGAFALAYLLFVGVGLAFAAVVGTPLLLLVVPDSGARAFGVFLTLLAAFGAVIVATYLGTVWVYWLPLMADRRLGVVDALRASRDLVVRSGFWTTFLVILVVGFIAGAVNSMLGSVTFGVGSLVGSVIVVPWQFAAYASMYLQANGEGGLLPSGFPGPSPAWQGGVIYAWSLQSWQPGWGAAGPAPSPSPAGPPPSSPPAGPPPSSPPVAGSSWRSPYPPAAAYGPFGASPGPGWAAYPPPPPPGSAPYGPPPGVQVFAPPPEELQQSQPPAPPAAPAGPPVDPPAAPRP